MDARPCFPGGTGHGSSCRTPRIDPMMTQPQHRWTLDTYAAALEGGRTSAVALVEACLARVEDEGGEGARTLLHVNRATALATAECGDGLRWVGATPSRFAGIPSRSRTCSTSTGR